MNIIDIATKQNRSHQSISSTRPTLRAEEFLSFLASGVYLHLAFDLRPGSPLRVTATEAGREYIRRRLNSRESIKHPGSDKWETVLHFDGTHFDVLRGLTRGVYGAMVGNELIGIELLDPARGEARGLVPTFAYGVTRREDGTIRRARRVFEFRDHLDNSELDQLLAGETASFAEVAVDKSFPPAG